MEGKLDRELNDIDVPLSGFVNVKECSQTITSVEIQLLRVEYCASASGVAR